MTKSVTLREVAERAGVSLGTASQALNNRPHVSAAARERVLLAAQELGYVPRRRSEATSISTIGLLIKHDSGPLPRFNYFFSYVQAGVELECHAHRINLMVAIVKTDQNNRPVDGWPRIIEEQSVDGFILVGLNVEPTFSELRQQLPNKPIVLVDSYAFGFPFDSVVIDNIGGAIQAVNYLIDRGHRHIGILGTNKHSPPDIRERREGYYWALAARQIDEVYVEESLMQREEGAPRLKALATARSACHRRVRCQRRNRDRGAASSLRNAHCCAGGAFDRRFRRHRYGQRSAACADHDSRAEDVAGPAWRASPARTRPISRCAHGHH